jgi:hypothetical protein
VLLHAVPLNPIDVTPPLSRQTHHGRLLSTYLESRILGHIVRCICFLLLHGKKVPRAQKSIALSSTEAEYMSLGDTCRQLVWIRSLFLELGIKLKPIPLCGDNQGSIFLASNPVQEKRIKHIDLRHHYIREVIRSKKIELFFIEGAENPADLFTKNLGRVKFQKFREQLGLEFYKD